jgi:phospholipase/carboxylesterase
VSAGTARGVGPPGADGKGQRAGEACPRRLANTARLQARPQPGTAVEAQRPGLRPLGLDAARDALLYLPTAYQASAPAPLVLSLHGAGGDAQGGLYPLQPLADDGGFLVLAVPSRGRTWDAVLGAFGPDLAVVDQALDWTFARTRSTPSRWLSPGFRMAPRTPCRRAWPTATCSDG